MGREQRGRNRCGGGVEAEWGPENERPGLLQGTERSYTWKQVALSSFRRGRAVEEAQGEPRV